MSTQDTKLSPPTAETPKPSGASTALRYTGIPTAWLSKRPKLPSRNWLIFLSVTSSLLGLYAYDRKKCRDIRNEYTQKVSHLAQEPMGSMELPRKVTVYTCKWPGDEDSTRSLRYFRKYVKPILVAAAIDYDVLHGRRHGDLTRQITEKIKSKRRIDEGLETPPPTLVASPVKLSEEEAASRELAGGSIIIGRMTFKEYMEGLRRGWTESPVRVDRQEVLAHELEGDGAFDEPEGNDPSAGITGEPIPTRSRLLSAEQAKALSPYKISSPSSPALGQSLSAESIPPPATIPPQPPLLLVPFINRIGLKQIPLMIVDFFNQRAKVAAGAEAAYKLIMGNTRPFLGPPTDTVVAPLFSPDEKAPETDLDFDRVAESYYRSSLSSFLDDIAKAREDYYKSLPGRLATARALARGEREPTKEEMNHPPPTEVELREERLKKELRWRGDEEGWNIIRPDKPVSWDERFRHALRVFTDPAQTNPDDNSR